ncbi:MAG TPA: hypothetical protein VFF52_17815 [Isosphaeraceae bacterium]|nr:hypothetical protein [Isosphaeraceae bacterium]
MPHRPIVRFRPGLERLEAKRLLSASRSTTQSVNLDGGTAAGSRHSVLGPAAHATESGFASKRSTLPTSFYAYRITNPKLQKVNLIPPFGQVLVQSRQPVPGQVYNVLYIAVKNATGQTFTASNDFQVRLNNQARSKLFPILTGSQQWKPNQWIVFYILTKKYYGVSFMPGGFELLLGGRRSTLVPGPSGIFLRLKYNPATFARTLNWIVAYGQGAQLGQGSRFGMPDTAINQIVAAREHRIDYGGHF